MSNEPAPEKKEQKISTPPVVASVLSSDRVVLNKGAKDGIKVGQRYLIYELTDEEIIDPITGESLGRLEEPKGTGKIVGVQEHIAVLESDQEPRFNRNPISVSEIFTPSAVMAPFRDPQVGDLVKRIF
jgi:hypothetical protein